MSRRQQQRRSQKSPAAISVVDAHPVNDGFQNLQARLGQGAGSIADAAGYAQSNLITRQPRQLEFMYRGSWIVGVAVDAVADDMTRAGIDFGDGIDGEAVDAVQDTLADLQIWEGFGDTIRWARLYGGGIGVIMIDGQDLATPLRMQTIKQDAFQGILPLSRWELMPVIQDLVGDPGPNIGRPRMYQIGPNASALQNKKVHHSRVLRFEGIKLPYFQRVAEQGWGLSIVERMFDRLLAFDSATTGAAQLVYKAYLRTLKVEGLKKILAAGGAAEEALAKNVEAIRQFQSLEGMTLIDAADDLETTSYTFAGLDQVLLQFGQQLSGATGIPLVRLFGQSPAGLNSTGESDIRLYYDAIKAQQERQLRSPLQRVLDVVHCSATGDQPPKGFGFQFNPLWQLGETEKSAIAKTTTETVTGAYDSGLIKKSTALKELKQSADVTGIFSNIEDDEIEEADNEPPETGEHDLDNIGGPPGGAAPKPAADPLAALQP